MATTPDLQKTFEKTNAAVVDAATAAPKAAAAIVEAAPAVTAALVESVANAMPKAKRTVARTAAPRKPAAKAKRVVKPTAAKAVKPAKITAAKAAPNAKGKTMTDTLKNLTGDMSQRSEKLAAELKTRAEGALAKGQQVASELTDFNKGNLEALVESGKIAAKGLEKLGQDQAEFARKSFEQSTAAFKTMAQVKSPTELIKLHSDYVRTSFDALVAQTSHSTEAMLKLAGEIAQPLSNRFAVAAEKVKLAA